MLIFILSFSSLPLDAFSSGLGMTVELADDVAKDGLRKAYEEKKGDLMDYWYYTLKIKNDVDFETKWDENKYCRLIEGLYSAYQKKEVKRRDLSRIGNEIMTDSIFYIFKHIDEWRQKHRR